MTHVHAAKRMVTAQPSEPWLCRSIATAIMAATFAHGAAITWDRWGDLIVDTGRELDTPRLLAEGRMLYRDVRYWYGPLVPYFHAALYGMFGAHVRTLTTAGLIVTALTGWLCYRTVRLFAGRLIAATAASAFFYVCAFGHYYGANVFQFVLPYSYPATYGMLLAVASVYFLLRFARSPTRSTTRLDLVVSGLCLGLTALCKLETLFAASAAHAVFVAAGETPGPQSVRRAWLGFALAALVPAAAYGYFFAHVGPGLAVDNLLLTGGLRPSDYVLQHSGLADPRRSLAELAPSGLLGAAVIAACWSAAWLDARLQAVSGLPRRRRSAMRGAVAATCLAAVAGLTWCIRPLLAFRALPAVLASLLVLLSVLRRRHPRERHAYAPWLVLLAFALASLARIPLRAGAEHYGFYLLVPGLIAMAALLGQALPARSFTGGSVSPGAYAAGVAVLAMLGVGHLGVTERTAEIVYGGEHAPRISTSYGTLPVARQYLGTVDRAIRHLRGQNGAHKAIVVPEGAAIAFLAGLTNPLGVHTFLPVDFSGAYDEVAMLRRLEAAAPDYVVLPARDVTEYGRLGFGYDYALEIGRWIVERYSVEADYRTESHRVRVLRRTQTTATSGGR